MSSKSTAAAFQSAAPAYVFLGVRVRVLLSSRQTSGQFSMIEGVIPPGGDGGLHVHLREDESMSLIEGELDVTIGDDVVTLRAGSSYFAPRGVPHRLRNRTEMPARAIVVTTPGGFDEFMAKAGIPLDDSIKENTALPFPDQIATSAATGRFLRHPDPRAARNHTGVIREAVRWCFGKDSPVAHRHAH